MLLYKLDQLDAAGQFEQLRQAARRGLMPKDRALAIVDILGPRYQGRGLIYRAGMWLLTLLAASAASGFLGLTVLFAIVSEGGYFLGPLILAVAGHFIVKMMTDGTRQCWRQGWDDFMAIAVYLCACSAWALLLFTTLDMRGSSVWPMLFAGFAGIGLLATLAYADALIALLALLAVECLPVALILPVSQQLLFFAPALYIPANLLLAAYARRQAGRFGLRAYGHVWQALRVACLVLAFVFGNVYATTQGYQLMYPGPQVLPYYQVYIVTTIALPLAYLGLGLYRKDRPLLWTGMATVVAARLSLLALWPAAHPAVNALVSGFLLTALGLWAYTRLKRRPIAGYSLEEEAFPEAASLAQQIQIQALGHETAKPHDKGFQFGGGSFGGGGGASEF